MGNVLVESSSLSAIANAIRNKNGSLDKYKPKDMAKAINNINTGSVPTGTKEISVTQNGTITENVSGFASAQITTNVPNSYSASDEGKVVSNGLLVGQTSAEYTSNNTYDTTLINEVTVNVDGGITPTGTISITQNGTVDVTQYASAEVDVPTGSTPVINSLSVTENGTYAAPTGVDGYSPVTVNVPASGDITFFADEVMQIYFTKGSESEIYVDFTKFPNLSSLQNAFKGDVNPTNWTKISIKPPTTRKDTRGMFYCSTSTGSNNPTVIEIDGTLLMSATAAASFCGNRKGLKTITGTLDLAGVTRGDFYSGTNYNNGFYNCNALETVNFANGSMPATTTNWTLQWCAALTDASLISIANALKDTYSGTITFHATPKARLSSIMGTVSTSDGLSVFAADAGGTVSLQDFLTTTKGVTLG